MPPAQLSKCAELRAEERLDGPEFFARFVATRTPVVLKQPKPEALDPAWHGDRFRDPAYLCERAGACKVKVERASDGAFGLGLPRQVMPFAKFMASLARGDERLYLTTQYDDGGGGGGEAGAGEDDALGTEMDVFQEALRSLCPPPTSCFLADFNIVPRLMGNLLPQQVNLWVGNSKTGSSSGLHHDRHDNMYYLARGRKRFVLFPPQQAPHLRMHGQVASVFPNGLIAYAAQGDDARADGLSTLEALVLRFKYMEARYDLLRKDLATDEALVSAESDVENAMQNILAYQSLINGSDSSEEAEEEAAEDIWSLGGLMEREVPGTEDEEGEEGEEGEDEDEDDGDGWQDEVDEANEDDDEGEEDTETEVVEARFNTGNIAISSFNTPASSLEAEEVGSKASRGRARAHREAEASNDLSGTNTTDLQRQPEREDTALTGSPSVSSFSDENASKREEAASEHPDSFSRIKTQDLHAWLFEGKDAASCGLQDLAENTTPFVAEMEAGDMLYLPSSWCHEVTSISEQSDNWHIAFNYWFHPPDDLEDYENPYTDKLAWIYKRQETYRAIDELYAHFSKGKRKAQEGSSVYAERSKRAHNDSGDADSS